MKGLFFLVFNVVFVFSIHAQVLTSGGNWDNGSNWDGGNIGDDISEDVSFDNNIGTVTIRDGFSYTVGTIQQNNGNTLTVSSTGQLNIGSASDAKDYSVGNTGVINVYGTMTVWGKLSPGNDLTLNVTGILIIKGDLDMGNGAALTVSGDVQIDGSLKGGNNTSVEIQSSGNVTIGQDIDVGNGSTLVGAGTMSFSGSCSDGGSGFCAGAPLPIELLSFNGQALDNEVRLVWQTASEENNDYFTIERSVDGKNYAEVGTVPGAGTSFERLNYSFTDTDPVFGQVYYRLKQTDFDGNFEYFGPVAVYFTQVREYGISLYPNPVAMGSTIHVKTGADEQEIVDVKIFDTHGHLLQEDELSGYTSSITLQNRLYPGVYLVQVTAGHVQRMMRLNIQ